MVNPWVLSFHIIFMVAWFSGLFYLPRLFMYHTLSEDALSRTRFCTMEKKLFWMIMTPAGVLTTFFGHLLFAERIDYYLHAPWMWVKLGLISVLWCFHIICGYLLYQFRNNRFIFSARFYRFFNEIPTLLLIGIVMMVIVKPVL